MKRFVLLVIIITLLAGCEDEDSSSSNISPTSDTSGLAATVNGQPITLQRLQQEVDAQATLASQAADPATLEAELLEQLIDQVLIEQYASRNNITVSDTMVQTEVEALRQEAATHNVDLTQITGYPETMTESVVRQILLTQAVRDHLVDNLTSTAPQVHARHILVGDDATARELLRQLESGEAEFGELAAQYSQDPSTASAGGDLGWIARFDLMQPQVEEAIFALPANARYPDPVRSSLGFHIIEVLARDDERPLTEGQQITQQRHAFQQLIETERETAAIVRYVGQSGAP